MGGRDHSETCEVCGYQRGGFDDLECECDEMFEPAQLFWLAHNLAVAGALCRAFRNGFNMGTAERRRRSAP